MTVRFYIIPIERNGVARGPKYFRWSRDPDPPGLTCRWSMKDYGSIDMGIVAADTSEEDHTLLKSKTDVYSFPDNIDTNMPQGEQTALVNFLEGAMIPAQWLAGTLTYRSVLRTITGMFLYMQRFLAILGYPSDPFKGLTMSTQFRNMTAAYQSAAQQAATELNMDWSGVRSNTTIRVILKSMADSWGAQPILFGVTNL